MRPAGLRLAFLAALALLAPVVGGRSEGQTTPKAAPSPAAREKTKKAAAPKAAEPAAVPVNLNTATPDELETLPGVGPALAKAIVAGRPYKSVDDLEKVKGFGKAKIDALRARVVATMPAPASPPPPVAPAPKAKAATPSTPAPAPKAKAATTPKAPGTLVNLNSASKDDLDILPGIGPVKAQAIIDNRPFAKIEDVMKVPGIKQGEFSRIKDMISVK